MAQEFKSQAEKDINAAYNHALKTKGVDAALAVIDRHNEKLRQSDRRDLNNKTLGEVDNLFCSGLGFGVPKLSGIGEKDFMAIQRNAGRHTYVWRDGKLVEK